MDRFVGIWVSSLGLGVYFLYQWFYIRRLISSPLVNDVVNYVKGLKFEKHERKVIEWICIEEFTDIDDLQEYARDHRGLCVEGLVEYGIPAGAVLNIVDGLAEGI